MSAIYQSTKLLGGQTALANQIGVKQSHVWNWINRHQRAPAKYIRLISKATNGAVSIDELLRDHEISDSPSPTKVGIKTANSLKQNNQNTCFKCQ